MKLKFSQLTFVCLLIVLFGANCAKDLHPLAKKENALFVAPIGSDKNPGTFEKPFKSLSKAAKVAEPGCHVYLRAGEYTETLKPLASGTASKPITFANYPKEKVTLIAGKKIQNWQRYKGNIYVADCSVDIEEGNNQLICDGDLMIAARTPNINGKEETVHAYNLDKVFKAFTEDDRIVVIQGTPKLQTDKPVNYVGRHGGHWATQTAIGQWNDDREMKVMQKTSQGYRAWWKAKGEGYAFGAMEYLDNQKEWYFDSQAKKLYFIPPQNKDPNRLNIYFKDKKYSIDLKDKKHIHLSGINSMMGTVLMDNSENCSVKNASLLYGGQHSFFTHPYIYTFNPKDQVLRETAGVFISGKENALEHCEIAYNSGASVILAGIDNKIINCRIHDSGLLGSYFSGIYVMQLAKNQGGGHEIGNNTMYNFGRSAIHLATLGTWNDPGKYAKPSKIHHNSIANAMLICDDGGAIYQFATDGNGSEISYNWIFGERGLMIYFDNFSFNYYVHHNVINNDINVNSPHKNINIYNNTLLCKKFGGAKYFWHPYNFVGNNISGVKVVGTDSKGLRPNFVNFKGEGENGLKYRVNSINTAGFDKGKPKVNNADSKTMPGFQPDVIGAYEYGKDKSSPGASWKPGCDWGGEIPAILKADDALLKITAADYSQSAGFENDALFIRTIHPDSWACYKNIDFSKGYSNVVFEIMAETAISYGEIELRLDKFNGECVAKIPLKNKEANTQFILLVGELKTVKGVHDLYLVVKAEPALLISELTFMGAGKTKLYPNSPRQLIGDTKKTLLRDQIGKGKLLIMIDNEFRDSGMWFDGAFAVKGCEPKTWLFFPKVDFGKGRDHVLLNLGETQWDDPNANVELRSGSPNGELLGSLKIEKPEKGKRSEQRMELKDVAGVHDLFVVFPKKFDGGLNYILFP